MSVTIRMTLSEEAGLVEGPPFIACCTLEFDEESLPFSDLDRFHRHIHRAMTVCCRAVHRELRRPQGTDATVVDQHAPHQGVDTESCLEAARG